MDPTVDARQMSTRFGSRRPRSRKIAAAPPPPEAERFRKEPPRNDGSGSRARKKGGRQQQPRRGDKKQSSPQRPRSKRGKGGGGRPPKPRPSVAGPDEEEWDGGSRFLALDCEMVGVGESGRRSALARVCLLGWDGVVVFDALVRVPEPVTDYRTFVSGIRKGDLDSDRAIDLEDCRSAVRSMVRGKVLVGHALKNDLRALDLDHPWHDLRDTAKYEPFMKARLDNGVLCPRKLKELAKEKLRRTIQPDGREHCPVEDAKAALDLYKSVRVKWEKVMDYKINKTREIQRQQEAQGIMPPGQ